jgi:WD40-like Beta Propeller Repeat
MRGLQNQLAESRHDGWRREKGRLSMRVRPVLLLAVAVAFVAGGCTNEPAGHVGGKATTEPPPDVSETLTSTSTPLPPGGLLESGTYTLDKTTVPSENSQGFDSVRITFTVPSGWEAWDLGILTPGETEGVTFWNVSTVPADPCHWQRGGPKVGPTVDDLATALANQSRRHATTPRDVTLAGYAGKHLTLTVPAHIEYGLDEFPSCDQGYFVSWDAPPSSAFGRYHQGPGQVDELWILDVRGFRLVVDASYWRDTPTRDRAEIHRIVKSVRIEPPLPEVIRVSGGALVAVDPDTGQSRTLVEASKVGSAAWSANGRWVAYTDNDSLVWELRRRAGLWVMRSSGKGEPRRVTATPSLWAWSPTGAQLAVIHALNHGHELILIDPSTGRRNDLGYAPGEYEVMAWSPDGTRIATGMYRGPSVYSIDVKSGDRSLLVRLPAHIAGIGGIEWSRDGTHLAIVGDHALYLANADGSGLRRLDGSVDTGWLLTPHPDPSDFMAWSPDGTELAYEDFEGRDERQTRIWTVSADGSDRSLVASHSNPVCTRGIQDPPQCWQGFGAPWGTGRGIAWSPDGSQIAFDVELDAVEPGNFAYQDRGATRMGYFVVNANGTSDPSHLDELTYLSWRGGWYYAYVFH